MLSFSPSDAKSSTNAEVFAFRGRNLPAPNHISAGVVALVFRPGFDGACFGAMALHAPERGPLPLSVGDNA
jgi:hypothetical protein